MYSIDLDSPSYYRSHPFKNQLNLPNSAFQNRDTQPSYSSIPQGMSHFQQTNKKHFAHKFNRSEIEENNILNEYYPEQEIQKSRVAKDKFYYRSLNVDDIQGTKPNTLISKAVKNRQKALGMMRKGQASQLSQPPFNRGDQGCQIHKYPLRVNQQILRANHSLVVQNEAIKLLSKNKSILESNSIRVLNNIETPNNNYQPHSNLFNKSQSISQTQVPNYFLNNNQKMNYHFKSPLQINPSPKKTLQRQQFDSEEQLKSLLLREPFQKQEAIKQLERQYSVGPGDEVRRHELHHKSRQLPTQLVRNLELLQIKQKHENDSSKAENSSSSKNVIYQPSNSRKIHPPTFLKQIPTDQLDIHQNINNFNIRKFNPTFLSFQSEGIKRSR